MRREDFYDKGTRLGGGGYFASIQEMEHPKHQAMHELLESMQTRKPKKFVQALNAVCKNGWDINQIVFQDSLDTWCTLGAHLASRSDVTIGRLFSAYLDYPGVDLSTQEATLSMKYLHVHMRNKDKDPEAFQSIQRKARVPLVHAFLRQWAQHLPPPAPLPKAPSNYQAHQHKKETTKHELARELFDKMERVGVDWTVKDEHGNGLGHVLVERESSQTLDFLLPWMKTLGVSMSSLNNFGMTPSSTAKHRIARTMAKHGVEARPQIAAFSQTIAILEHGLLQDSTPQAEASTRPSRRI